MVRRLTSRPWSRRRIRWWLVGGRQSAVSPSSPCSSPSSSPPIVAVAEASCAAEAVAENHLLFRRVEKDSKVMVVR